ncbi:MAG TPA: SRPBCC family protein, partial [Acidimicrobiales bacterium]|nr:SRPBCC family protein [Acidimicrobiales bacterium]
MDLSNEFRVGVSVDEAWGVLTDVERIAPCMPGAQLQEVEGDEYRGIVKVKVGPITAQYKGAARFVERDDAGHRAVLRAEGRETRGQGNANATITALLEPDGDGTKVSVNTDLTVTGRVAQFGRGVMADVSAKLLGQFVDCLEMKLLAGNESGEAEAPAVEAAAGGDAGGATAESAG